MTPGPLRNPEVHEGPWRGAVAVPKVQTPVADVGAMTQMELSLSEENGLTLWQLVEALQEAAEAVALTAEEAEKMACLALSDLLENGIVQSVPGAPEATELWDRAA